MRNLEKNKNTIRKEVLKARKKLTPLEIMFASDKISEYVLSLDELNEAESVLIYADYNNEVMTDKLVLSLMMKGKKIYMPKVFGDEMEFFRVFSLDELEVGAFNIREPIDIEDLKYEYKPKDLIIMPGVAFDEDGNRIGYGKGYYDRYLEEKTELIKVGICFKIQIVDKIPAQDTDVKLDYIISED